MHHPDLGTRPARDPEGERHGVLAERLAVHRHEERPEAGRGGKR
jgi:hypothetical protein